MHKRLHIWSLVDIKNNVFLGTKTEDVVKEVAEEGGPEGEGQEKKLLGNKRLKGGCERDRHESLVIAFSP